MVWSERTLGSGGASRSTRIAFVAGPLVAVEQLAETQVARLRGLDLGLVVEGDLVDDRGDRGGVVGEDLVGRELGPTEPLAVDQARIDAFADATLDHQWIHVDRERAATGPFGTTIVHGYLTLSLLVRMVESLDIFPPGVTVINYGIDKLRYPAPVPSGSDLVLNATVKAVEPKGEGRALMTLACRVAVPGSSTPALVADVLYLFIDA